MKSTPKSTSTLSTRVVAEFLGTAFLVAAVVGSGIMAERLCGGNVGLALLANTVATGAALVALILAFGPISGAHLNPVVSLADAIEGGLPWREMPGYALAQIVGGISGTMLAHEMFGMPMISLSRHIRSGPSQILSEFVATFGLMSVIWGCARASRMFVTSNASPEGADEGARSYMERPVAIAVGCYIAAAYWFTASTSFANPAVTVARSLSDTFSGIRPVDALPFILAQFAGGLAATFLFRWLAPGLRLSAEKVVVPHPVK
ncbi:MAG TPA: MIP/aquaporin family protein [Terriglobales bacterium]